MAKFTSYAMAALPATSIDVNGLYFIKGAAETSFKVYIRDNANATWIPLDTISGVKSVNGITTSGVQLDLSMDASGIVSITGGTQTINLDARFDKKVDSLAWSRITGRPTTLAGYGITDAALDNTVVHNTGNETVAGVKTFSSSPVVPTATTSTQAANKGQLDSTASGLQNQIDNLSTTVASGLKYKGDIDASTNPNYPAASVGDTWLISVAGKIGGASGIAVSVGNMIVCKTAGAAGTQGVVGVNWTVLQSDLDQATETIAGVIAIATSAEVTTGTNDTKAVTPLKLQQKIDAADTASNAKFVRYDTAQALTAGQKTQAQTNIGAANDASVVHLAGTETITGAKTFSLSPNVPNATLSGQAAAFGQIGTVGDGKYVRYDTAAQGLAAANKTNARTNIDAAGMTDVQWGQKDW